MSLRPRQYDTFAIVHRAGAMLSPAAQLMIELATRRIQADRGADQTPAEVPVRPGEATAAAVLVALSSGARPPGPCPG